MPTRLFRNCGLFLLLAAPASADEPKVPEDWAYKPVVKRDVPKVAGKAITPVDSFLLAKLEARKLSFAPPADKAALLRRVTFDLTGLPPTPDELATFLARGRAQEVPHASTTRPPAKRARLAPLGRPTGGHLAAARSEGPLIRLYCQARLDEAGQTRLSMSLVP